MEKLKFIQIGTTEGFIPTQAAELLLKLGVASNERGFQHALLSELAILLADPTTEVHQRASQKIGDESVTFLQYALSEVLGTGKSLHGEIIADHPELAGLDSDCLDGVYISRATKGSTSEFPTLETRLFNALMKMSELRAPLFPNLISAGPLLRMVPDKLRNRKQLGKNSVAEIKEVLYQLMLGLTEVEADPIK